MNNIVETSIYSKNKKPDYRKNIALVGYVPTWKGYLRSLEILNELNEYDNFNLYLFGKDWYDIDWVINNKNHFEYMKKCEYFIEEHDLEGRIIKKGWTERSDMFSDIGFVLSVSDIEGSHLSPTEAFADLSLSVILNWPGASYVYPSEIIFDNTDSMVEYILNTYNNDEKYLKTAKYLNEYCINEFSEEYLVKGLNKIFEKENHDTNSPIMSLNKIKNEYIENNKLNQEKLLNQIPNSFIVENEYELDEILKNNPKDKLQIFIH